MKRKADNEAEKEGEQDKKCKTLNLQHQQAATKRDLTITDLANELIVSVLSFLHFYDRSRVRGVCRRLLNVADSMPNPTKSGLKILIVNEPSSPIPCQIEPNRTNSIVEMRLNTHGRSVEQIIESIPPLCTVRPTHLAVRAVTEEEVNKSVDARFVGHLAKEVGATVSFLHVCRISSPSLIDLQEAFAEFEKRGAGVLHEFRLEGGDVPLAHVVSASTFLRGLSSLSLTLSKEMIRGWVHQSDSIGQCLGLLAALPDLKVLKVLASHATRDAAELEPRLAAIASIVLGCSMIPQLRSLALDWMADTDEYMARAISTALGRLTNLRDLGMLLCPTTRLWSQVTVNNSLKGLGIGTRWEDTENIERFVSACNQYFPFLSKLVIHFVVATGTRDVSSTSRQMVDALAGLCNHPSLSVITFDDCDRRIRDETTFLAELREALGDRITLRIRVKGEGF